MNILQKFFIWLERYTPVFCGICKKMIFKKDVKYEQTTMGISVPLCKECDHELNHPYSSKLGKIK